MIKVYKQNILNTVYVGVVFSIKDSERGPRVYKSFRDGNYLGEGVWFLLPIEPSTNEKASKDDF